MKDIVIIGSGGVAKGVLWLINSINEITNEWNILGVVDEETSEREDVLGYPFLGNDDLFLSKEQKIYAVCAIGFPEIKKKVVNKYSKNKNIIFPTIISPNAFVANNVSFGIGTVVYAGTVIAPNTNIGSFVCVNYNCTIGHDVRIDDYCCINPGAVVSGGDIIEEGCLIGANSTIIQDVKVAAWSTIGLGSTLFKNITEKNSTIIGNPGMVLKGKSDK